MNHVGIPMNNIHGIYLIMGFFFQDYVLGLLVQGSWQTQIKKTFVLDVVTTFCLITHVSEAGGSNT